MARHGQHRGPAPAPPPARGSSPKSPPPRPAAKPATKPPVPRAQQPAVSEKISKLVHEGKPQDQAVAMSLNMAREHRLGPKGGYKKAK